MATFNYIKCKLLDIRLFHCSKNWGRVPTYTTNEDDVDAVHWSTSGILPMICTLPLSIFWIVRSMTRWFLAIMTILKFAFKVRLPCWRCPTRMWCRLPLNIKLEASFGSAICQEIGDYDRPDKGWCWACTRFLLM